MLKEVIILSYPRNGTNYFCDTIGNFKGTYQMYEIFNPAGAFGVSSKSYALNAIAQHLGEEIESVKDAKLVNFFRRRPVEALNLLNSIAEKNGDLLLTYKIFPNQLSPQALQDLFTRPNISCCIILRNRLDVFISYEKARMKNTWKNAKTEDLKIEVNCSAFLKWANKYDQWFIDIERICRNCGIAPYYISYEADINHTKNTLLQKQLCMLRTFGVNVDAPPKSKGAKFKRQDVNSGPFQKISNAEELRGALRSEKKYNYALSKPLCGI